MHDGRTDFQMNPQDAGVQAGRARHRCSHMKRGCAPGRAIVRLQKQVIGYQGRHMSDVRVCEENFGIVEGRRQGGHRSERPSVVCWGSAVRGAQEKEILTVVGQGSCHQDPQQVNTCCLSVTHTKASSAYCTILSVQLSASVQISNSTRKTIFFFILPFR